MKNINRLLKKTSKAFFKNDKRFSVYEYPLIHNILENKNEPKHQHNTQKCDCVYKFGWPACTPQCGITSLTSDNGKEIMI